MKIEHVLEKDESYNVYCKNTSCDKCMLKNLERLCYIAKNTGDSIVDITTDIAWEIPVYNVELMGYIVSSRIKLSEECDKGKDS